MVNSAERRRLIEAYTPSRDPPAALGKAVAGLLIIAMVAAVGAHYTDEATANAATLSTPKGVADR